jgi:hypothetical protein
MRTAAPEPTPPTSQSHLRLCGLTALLALALGLAARAPSGTAAPPAAPSDKEPVVDGQPLFAQWPGKGQQKPDAAIILTGQTYGLLQPCGCSRPQKGGLERRMQLMNTLKAKGWPVAGVDLGDIYPDKTSFQDQGLLRYKTTMNALREMGYIAVGVGKTEFTVEIDRVLGEYALQKQQPPFILAGNLMGVAGGKPIPREERFPVPPGANRPMIDLAEVAAVGRVTVGVAGIVGKSLAGEVVKAKFDPSVTFADNAGVLTSAVKALAAKKSQLNVLIYQGTAVEAEALASAWPQFQVILCRADDPEPPASATKANGGNTLIVKVGEKGRYVGVLGAFKKNGGFDLHYQLVPLDEYYITPGTEAQARKANKTLPLLESYAAEVRDSGFLAQAPKKPHNAQIAKPELNLHFVGSDACKGCHAAEHAQWARTPHGHALDTLEKVAKRPSLRNFDPECVVCHTVGFAHDTGYVDDKKTPELKHVGCENCHGPGSGHAANPKAQDLLPLLSPWKRPGAGNLPAELIKKMAETPPVERGKLRVEPADQVMINIAAAMCGKCHDPDNDPHFDFYTYWPKVNHSGMAPPGGWPVTPKK